MNRTIEIIDPEYERKLSRQRKVIFVVILISLSIFGYPVVKDYEPQWLSLKAARKFSLYLSMIKTRAIVTKTVLEARFRRPNLIEVYEVSSCGPNATHNKLWEIRLSDFEPDVVFATESFVREQIGSKEPILPRF